MRVIVQARHATELHDAAMAVEPIPDAVMSLSDKVDGLQLDPNYPPVQQPSPVIGVPSETSLAMTELADFSMRPEDSLYLLRGTVPDDQRSQFIAVAAATERTDIVGVFSDPVIESCPVCPGDPPRGNAGDVTRLLDKDKLEEAGMDGRGVFVAIVDTGINLDHLAGKNQHPLLDATNSWTPANVTTRPGEHPVNHGTMCAYDVGIVASSATLLDHAVLLSTKRGATAMSGLLSDAVIAYAYLQNLLRSIPWENRRLVISNSWGMFDPAWDFQVGHPGNYSDNAQHPFNIIVRSLVSAGADILFAAGNCGAECADGRCRFGQGRPICGANSLPSVLSVAGVDCNKQRVGYSSQGPGRLGLRKPSLCGYTHFAGSGVYPADGGTSAACPVLAGYVAAIRTQYPTSQLTPMQLRSLLYKSAEDLGGTGYDFDHGWGVPKTDDLLARLP